MIISQINPLDLFYYPAFTISNNELHTLKLINKIRQSPQLLKMSNNYITFVQFQIFIQLFFTIQINIFGTQNEMTDRETFSFTV